MGFYDFTTGITASDDVTTSETLSSSTQFVWVDATKGNVIITLPAAADNTRTVYTIKKIDNSGNTVTIDANGTEKIDGELEIVLNLQYQYVTIVCDGDEWFIIGGEYVKMEDLLKKLLNEQIELLYETLIKVKQNTLHLAKLSGEKITDKDVS